MKEYKFNTCGGLTFSTDVPETPDEFNKLDANRPNAVLDEAIANVIYRGTNNDCRDALTEALMATYGVQQKTVPHPEGKKDAKGQVIQLIDPKDDGNKFFKRVAAEQGVELKAFQPIADRLSRTYLTKDGKWAEKRPDGSYVEVNMKGEQNGTTYTQDQIEKRLITFDPTARERKGPKANEPTKADVESAKILIAQGPKKLAVALKKIETVTGEKVELVNTGNKEQDEAENLKRVAWAYMSFRKNPLAALR